MGADGCVAVSGDAVMACMPSAWSIASDSPQVLAPPSCVQLWNSVAVGEVATDKLVLADAAAKFLVVHVLAALVPGSALLLATEEGWLSCVAFVSFLGSSSLVEVGPTASFPGN